MAYYDPDFVLVEMELDSIFAEAQARDAGIVGLANTFGGATSSSNQVHNMSQHYVRRPLRGIKVKRESFATLSVPGAFGMANSSMPEGIRADFTSNFLLQSVSETRAEKFQPITTFGAAYGYFFGEQPRMVTFNAVLLNSADFQWELEWWDNYDKLMRGTRLVDRGNRAVLAFEDNVIEGYLIQASTNKNTSNPSHVQLSFTMFVVSANTIISDIGGKFIDPIHAEAQYDIRALDFLSVKQDGNLAVDSTTAEVRARNIKKSITGQDTGLIASVRNALDEIGDFIDKVGAAIDNATDWLYGRNMVIPAGFAGSERFAGQAVFAEGSGAEGLAGLNIVGQNVSSIDIRLPGAAAWVAPKEIQEFYANIDEYPARAAGAATSPLAVNQESTRDLDNQWYTQLAEKTFSEFGYDITNETGQAQNSVLRALGRATFTAASYVAMTTGVSRTLSELQVIGGVTGNTDAEAQQAAAERLS